MNRRAAYQKIIGAVAIIKRPSKKCFNFFERRSAPKAPAIVVMPTNKMPALGSVPHRLKWVCRQKTRGTKTIEESKLTKPILNK
jgi:hypothetical protein